MKRAECLRLIDEVLRRFEREKPESPDEAHYLRNQIAKTKEILATMREALESPAPLPPKGAARDMTIAWMVGHNWVGSAETGSLLNKIERAYQHVDDDPDA